VYQELRATRHRRILQAYRRADAVLRPHFRRARPWRSGVSPTPTCSSRSRPSPWH